VFRKLQYDPQRDFQPITIVDEIPLTCVVHPSLRVRTIAELVAVAKAKPGELRFASAGNGSMPHLATELFLRRADIQMTHVPFKGGALGLNALFPQDVICCVSPFPR